MGAGFDGFWGCVWQAHLAIQLAFGGPRVARPFAMAISGAMVAGFAVLGACFLQAHLAILV